MEMYLRSLLAPLLDVKRAAAAVVSCVVALGTLGAESAAVDAVTALARLLGARLCSERLEAI